MAPAYKVTYFEFAGLAECIRWLFNYGGVEFEDYRIPGEKWLELKEKMPFGQMPLLEHNGKTVNQSVAISRYLAKKFKLTGKDEWEDLEIDALVDTLNDFRMKMYPVIQAEESKKEAEKDKLFNEIVPFYCERFNKNVKNGYLIGGHLTWADLYFVTLFDAFEKYFQVEVLSKYANLNKVKNNVINVPAIKQWIAKRPEDKPH